jgi:hypothetical protein
MALGERAFRGIDPPFSRNLNERVSRMMPLLAASLKDYGSTRVVSGYTIPRWLLYESGADVTSELLLGLLEYRKSHDGDSLTSAIAKLAGGLVLMQDGQGNTPPYGLHRSWETLWHMWGNGQTQALATAGLMLHDSVMTASAEREARGWYARLLMEGFLKEYDVARGGPPARFDQIAYGVRPMAVGLIRLFEATGKREYLLMAGLAASWLTGNNAAGRAMYDPASGRCFDGIRDSLTLNLNSGAESTIEALYTLVEVGRYPVAAGLLSCRKAAAGSNGEFAYAIFRSASGAEVTLARNLAAGTLSVYEGTESEAFCRKERIP